MGVEAWPCLPSEHWIQYVACTCGWYWPAWQLVHAALFSAYAYRPLGHAVQSSPSMYVPGLQVPQYPADASAQFLRSTPAASHGAHGVQLVLPVDCWYWPSGQLWHVVPCWKCPTAHVTQCPADVGVHPLGYSPALQLVHGWHALCAGRVWNCPVAHAWQCASEARDCVTSP